MSEPRLSRAERQASIEGALDRLFSEARSQGDFTAARAAAAAGISRQLLYRLAGDRFRTMKARLPGGPSGNNELAIALRRENRRLERALLDLRRQHEDCPTIDDMLALTDLNERLDEENRALRDRLRYVGDRLDREGALVTIDATPEVRLPPAHLRALPHDSQR